MIKINVKRFFQPVSQSTFASGALLLLRLVVGSAFVIHGWGKIQSPLSWMGPQATIPGFFQFLAAISEFGGGICWILGSLTPIAALGIGSTMTVAVHMHMILRKDPFVNSSGGSSYELALVYLTIAILILTLGPGKFSLDKKIFGDRK